MIFLYITTTKWPNAKVLGFLKRGQGFKPARCVHLGVAREGSETVPGLTR